MRLPDVKGHPSAFPLVLNMIPIKPEVVEVVQPDDGERWTMALIDGDGNGDLSAIIAELRKRYPRAGIKLVVFDFRNYSHFSNGIVRRTLKECSAIGYDIGAQLCRRILFHRKRKGRKTPKSSGYTLAWTKGPQRTMH
jgi:hypothetical protein